MTRRSSYEDKAIAGAVEQQMKRWAVGLEVQSRLGPEQALARLPAEVHPYVAFTRETGAGGTDIALRVAERLGFPSLGRELLDAMAERYSLWRDSLESVDERTFSWVRDVFVPWIDHRVVTQNEYVCHLGQILLIAARSGSAVFVGRAAHMFLPRARGVAVRVVAPSERRLERVMEVHGFDSRAAEVYLARRDEGRQELIRRYFRAEAEDPLLYDVVINSERFDRDEAADFIVALFRRRFG